MEKKNIDSIFLMIHKVIMALIYGFLIIFSVLMLFVWGDTVFGYQEYKNKHKQAAIDYVQSNFGDHYRIIDSVDNRSAGFLSDSPAYFGFIFADNSEESDNFTVYVRYGGGGKFSCSLTH